MKISNVKGLIYSIAVFYLATLSTTLFAESQYQDFSKMAPSASIEFKITSLKLLAGMTWGKGTLHYQNKTYPIKLAALTIGGAGFKEMTGSAQVYNLKSLDDFPGVYGGGTAGVAVGDVGAQKMTIQNGNGVVLMLEVVDSEGAQIAASLGGLEIHFDH